MAGTHDPGARPGSLPRPGKKQSTNSFRKAAFCLVAAVSLPDGWGGNRRAPEEKFGYHRSPVHGNKINRGW
jgi:hypothetical protein